MSKFIHDHPVGAERGTTGPLLLLGTSACHLCQQAETLIYQTLAEHSVSVRLDHKDIIESDELMSTYATRIPVLCFQGRELDWPFDDRQLRAFLSLKK